MVSSRPAAFCLQVCRSGKFIQPVQLNVARYLRWWWSLLWHHATAFVRSKYISTSRIPVLACNAVLDPTLEGRPRAWSAELASRFRGTVPRAWSAELAPGFRGKKEKN